MTAARLLSAPGEGHGLTTKHTDKHYRALVDGREPGVIIALVVLEPVGTSQRKTAKGLHRSVTYEAKRLEPVLDAHQAAELGFLVQNLYEQRTSNVEPRYLPLGFSDLGEEEKRRRTIESIEDWADEAGVPGHELEAMWRDHFGIGEGEEWSYGNQGVPGDYRKASTTYLLEFGYAREILSREAKLPHEEREDAEEQDAAGEPEPEDAPADAEPEADDGDAEGAALRRLESVPAASFSG